MIIIDEQLSCLVSTEHFTIKMCDWLTENVGTFRYHWISSWDRMTDRAMIRIHLTNKQDLTFFKLVWCDEIF